MGKQKRTHDNSYDALKNANASGQLKAIVLLHRITRERSTLPPSLLITKIPRSLRSTVSDLTVRVNKI